MMQSKNYYDDYRSFFKKMLYELQEAEIQSTDSFYNNFKQVIKSQFILMLYTTIESVVMTGIQDIFDDISTKKYNFYNLRDEVKKIYLKFNIKNKERHINNIIDRDMIEILDKIEKEEIVNISLLTNLNNENPFSAGSLDCKSIRENILEKFGIDTIDENTFKKCHNTLQNIVQIKDYRNKLAHGEETFENIGRNITIDTLKEYFLSWSMFLRKYVKNIQKYITNEEY